MTGEWGLSNSDSGFNNREIMPSFVDDLDKFCINNGICKPVILFADGFRGHYSLEIIEELDKRGILLWLLRAHMSHIIQPLDVLFFNAVKRELNMLTQQWQGKHPGENLTRYTFVLECLYPAMEAVCRNPEMIAKSFALTGLCPWNPSAVARYKLKPGEIFDQETMDEAIRTGEENDQPLQVSEVSGEVSGELRGEDSGEVSGELRVEESGEVNEAEDGEMEVEFVVGPPVHQEALASDDHEVEENPDAADFDTEDSEFWIENLRKARQLTAFIASVFKKEHNIDISNMHTAMERVRLLADMAKADLETEPDTLITFSFEDVITGSYLSINILLTKEMYERIVRKPGVTHRQQPESEADQPQVDDGHQPQVELQMTYDDLDRVSDQLGDTQQQLDEEEVEEIKPIDR